MNTKQVIVTELLLALPLFMIVLLAGNMHAADWQVEKILDGKSFDFMSDRSMAVDSKGRLFVAYGGKHLYLATYSTTSWSTETLDSADNVGYSAAIALDADGYIHASYYDSGTQALKYAFKNRSTGIITTSTIDSSITVDEDAGTSIGVDSTGTVISVIMMTRQMI